MSAGGVAGGETGGEVDRSIPHRVHALSRSIASRRYWRRSMSSQGGGAAALPRFRALWFELEAGRV